MSQPVLALPPNFTNKHTADIATEAQKLIINCTLGPLWAGNNYNIENSLSMLENVADMQKT